MFGWLALALAALSFTTKAHANVYATDIQINATLTGTATSSVGSPVSITYHLNDTATAGVTVNILHGSSVVASFAGTTNIGLNTVSWTPSVAGTYSVSITAGAAGYPTWQQISPLTTNYVAVFPLGMAVDKNTNSPYYGRVILGCAIAASANGVTQQCGFYKINADGTPADEGSFGFANFTTNDGGLTASGQMPSTWSWAPPVSQWRNPSTIRIGEDDRIYWQDNSDGGAIVACDMLATTNQVIICAGNGPTGDGPGSLVGPGYGNSPAVHYVNQYTFGWVQFDIINVGTASSYTGTNGIYTGQAALFLSDWDFPCAGVWMWHLVGAPGSMTADPTDTYGQQVVPIAGDIALRTDGIAVDYNLDLFVGQSRFNAGDPAVRAAFWTNWNGGTLPPGDQGGAQGGGSAYSATSGEFWSEGASSGSGTDRSVFDVVMNSKSNPTLLARSHAATSSSAGIDLLIPFNPVVTITGASLNGSNLTINCVSSSPYAPVASQLSLYGSTDVTGPYTPVTATFTGSNGVFQATTSVSDPVGYFRAAYPPVAGTSAQGSVATIKGTGPEADTLAGIDTGVYYSGVAFDNVGNLYGANASDNYWRVWSPPGPNTNTTVAVVKLSAH